MTGPDPRLLHQLSALADDDPGYPSLGPAGAVRAGGDRRRARARAALVAAGSAVLILAGSGAYAALAPSDEPGGLDTATPTAAPTRTPSPSSSATPTPTPTPSSTPTPTPTPSPSPSPAPAPSPSPTPVRPPPFEPAATAAPVTPSPTASPAASRPSSQPPRRPSASPTTSPPVFPPEATLAHGESFAAVYVALAYESADARLARALEQVEGVGYDAAVAPSIECDAGAYEQLGLDRERQYAAVVLYFADRPTAQQFVDAFEPGVVGTADVTTYCLD